MSSFKRTEIIKFAEDAPDLGYGDGSWGRWDHPTTIKEYGAINKIDISPTTPNYFAITSYSKVLLYDPVIKDVYKTMTKFQDACFGAKFRRDGKLICVGTSEGQLKIFDVATKTLLRILRGHSTATHRCDFTPDSTHVLSFSDDKTVGLWDLPSESLVQQFSSHTDYVRCGAPFNLNSDLIVSGGYDKAVILWDKRVGVDPVLTFDHGSPVEDLLVLPGDGMIVSAGGSSIKVWDLAGGGTKLANITPHHKTITCLSVVDGGGSIVSGSLDRQAKRIDMQTFRVTGSLSFPSSLLSVGVDADSKYVVGGMVDGLVQIFEKKDDTFVNGVKTDSRRVRKEKSHRYLQYTQFTPAAGDIVVDTSLKDIELRHDKLLRKYEYGKALDATMKPVVQRTKPEYAHSLLYELMRREGLRSSLAGRDENSLILILNYVLKNLTNPRFCRVLLYVAEILIDLYLPVSGNSSKVEKMFKDLEKKLGRELRLVDAIVKFQGVLDIVTSAGGTGRGSTRVEREILLQEKDKKRVDKNGF